MIEKPPAIWATETTYPSGPTAGDVCKVQPSGDLVLPGVKTPAEYSNYNFNAWTTAISHLYNYVVSTAVGNWSPVIPFGSISGDPTGSVYWTQFGYDTYYGRWLGCLFSNDGTNNHVNIEATYDGGRTWSNLYTSLAATGISIPVAFAVGNFGNNVSLAIASGASNATAHALVPDTSTDTTTTLTGPCTLACAYTVHNTSNTGNFFTYYIHQTSGTFTGYFQVADILGTTWNTLAASLPANWISGTNHVGAILYATGPQDIVNVQTIICQCGVTAGTDVARVLLHQTGGSTFTDITPAFLTNMVITGVAYSVNDGLWGILCNNGGGNIAFLYTSPDLVNWTQVWYTITNAGGGLAVVGSVWCMTQISGVANANFMFSGEVATLGAAATWHYASVNLSAATLGKGGIFSNGNQLLLASSNNVAVSNQAGFPPIYPSI